MTQTVKMSELFAPAALASLAYLKSYGLKLGYTGSEKLFKAIL